VALKYYRQDRQTAKTAICRFNLAGSESTIKTTSGGLGGLAVLAEMKQEYTRDSIYIELSAFE